MKRKLLNILKIYENNTGNKFQTCKAANISRCTLDRYIKENHEFAERIAEIDESMLDFSESQLYQLIRGGRVQSLETKDVLIGDRVVTLRHETRKQLPPDGYSVQFHLKTKGKRRGYAESSTVDLNVNNVNPIPLSPEALEAAKAYRDAIMKEKNETD
jgi:hypothetical protein